MRYRSPIVGLGCVGLGVAIGYFLTSISEQFWMSRGEEDHVGHLKSRISKVVMSDPISAGGQGAPREAFLAGRLIEHAPSIFEVNLFEDELNCRASPTVAAFLGISLGQYQAELDELLRNVKLVENSKASKGSVNGDEFIEILAGGQEMVSVIEKFAKRCSLVFGKPVSQFLRALALQDFNDAISSRREVSIMVAHGANYLEERVFRGESVLVEHSGGSTKPLDVRTMVRWSHLATVINK